ncbi:signal peptidase I [Ornithinimicrobium murale]|uniref:signal peptidase I n=1 Tax=Ornithinimicrobium murale TaxID=1050153 RepID=UPI001EE07D02|nr:signal peptidase I [Ornithinimicrobium murale]
MTHDSRSAESGAAAPDDPSSTAGPQSPAVDEQHLEVDERHAEGAPTVEEEHASGATAVHPGRERSASQGRTRRHPVVHFVREVLIIGVTALLISFLIKTFLVQAFWIPSGSMETTLVYGDRVLVSKIQAGPMSVERGDIIVFEDPGGWLPPSDEVDRGPIIGPLVEAAKFVGIAPEGESHHLIKRVIGVGGDHIVCCDDQGRLTVNDEALIETYLFEGDEPSQENFDITVPEDSYWMMGDHRSYSRDSRAHDDGTGTAGSIPADRVVGQAFALVWPLDRFEFFTNPQDVFGSVPDPVAGHQ